MWSLENTYRDLLPEQFYNDQAPQTVESPGLVCFNQSLASTLDIQDIFQDQTFAQNVLSGKEVIPGSHPIAQAYAGHQFGQFTMLGDGRAVLLGEHTVEGNRYDIQLKGSGKTKYSRRGDGRATLTSMLREYLMSEAMHHLGIPTTRSLAVVKTGEPVYREAQFEGAVLTRVAQSHIRVGTFEYARFFCPPEQLAPFTKYVIGRHYPALKDQDDYALELIKAVMDRQVDLLVNWMRVGFIHGVMNTDNMSIAGETIDYGPCAFMNVYHPNTVFSSIDRQGRYAFSNQPRIAHWNISILANALLPLIDEDEKVAVSKAQELLNTFPQKYNELYLSMMCDKLGIAHQIDDDEALIEDLLKLLTKHEVDYTNFFSSLYKQTALSKELRNIEAFSLWFERWESAYNRFGDQKLGLALMSKNNPILIPRNHLVEAALSNASAGDMTSFENLLKQLSDPYTSQNEIQFVPEGYDQRYQTFCGT